MFVKVFLRQTTSSFDRIYTYQVPASLENEITEGKRVIVPFGRQNMAKEGIIFSYALNENTSDEKSPKEIKFIQALLDEEAILSTAQIKLLAQMKQRYACTYDQAASLMLPSGLKISIQEEIELSEKQNILPEELLRRLKDSEDLCVQDLLLSGFTRTELMEYERQNAIRIRTSFEQKSKAKSSDYVALSNPEEAASLLNDGVLGSVQQEAIVDYLLENGESPLQEVLNFCDVNRSSIRTLQKKNLLTIVKKKDALDVISSSNEEAKLFYRDDFLQVDEQMLSEEQSQALSAITNAMKKNLAKEFLLHGVTGSGKTEVYMHACKKMLEMDKSAIILVPEISLTPQMTAQFEKRFENQVAVLHSRLSPRERFDQFWRIKKGLVKIVVGARSAIFSPLKNLGLIIIDEEQEDSYQSERNPKYHARSIARLRQRNENAILILGSATPSVETYIRCNEGKSELLLMKNRPGKAQLPETITVDLRKEWNPQTDGLLSHSLLQAMHEALDRKEHVLLFLNRRGYAANYLCSSCGKTHKCPHCSIGMTYHKNRNRLICHYCGHIENLQETCQFCGEDSMKLLGIGTQKLEEICQANFPNSKIIRMDMDETSGKFAHAKLLKAFSEAESAILIGTQMIAKGHDFPKLTVSAVIQADQILGRNDIRSSEKAFQLIAQTAGRAGRKDLAGKVFIQAFDINHYAITTAANHDYEAFLKEELLFRKTLQYPPYTVRAILQISAENESEASKAARQVQQLVKDFCQRHDTIRLSFLPANKHPIYRLQNRYRWQMLFQSDTQNGTMSLSMLWQFLSLQKVAKGVTLSFTLDPA